MKEFFQDDKGRLSMCRLLSFLLIAGGILLAFIRPNVQIVTYMILIGKAGKVSQKYVEMMQSKILSDYE